MNQQSNDKRQQPGEHRTMEEQERERQVPQSQHGQTGCDSRGAQPGMAAQQGHGLWSKRTGAQEQAGRDLRPHGQGTAADSPRDSNGLRKGVRGCPGGE
jgi:hypothetical protein